MGGPECKALHCQVRWPALRCCAACLAPTHTAEGGGGRPRRDLVEGSGWEGLRGGGGGAWLVFLRGNKKTTPPSVLIQFGFIFIDSGEFESLFIDHSANLQP